MGKYLTHIISIFFLFFFSCCSIKNKEYASDFRSLDKTQFAKKYYTLFTNKSIDFSKIKKEKAYLTYTNNFTFQIIIFSEDGYVYQSQLMPIQMLNSKLPTMKLLRGNYFSIKGDILKFESKVPSSRNISSIISEGIIRDDTIFMKKKYNATGYKNTRNLFNKYFHNPDIKIYFIGNDYIIE